MIQRKIAKFEKVSRENYKLTTENLSNANKNYEDIILPKRATKGSAGYDFYSPIDFTLNPSETITISTGIRVKMAKEWVLQIFPRSGLGFKFRLRLDNTVGIIDSDYYFSANEGNIFIRITNESKDKILTINKGDGFAQGIFLIYGITEDDEVETVRNGGFGSTDKADY